MWINKPAESVANLACLRILTTSKASSWSSRLLISYHPGQIITSQLLISHQKPLSYSTTATFSLPDINLFGQGYSLLQLLSSLVLILCFTLYTVAKRKTAGNRKKTQNSEDIFFNLTCCKQSQNDPISKCTNTVQIECRIANGVHVY